MCKVPFSYPILAISDDETEIIFILFTPFPPKFYHTSGEGGNTERRQPMKTFEDYKEALEHAGPRLQEKLLAQRTRTASRPGSSLSWPRSWRKCERKAPRQALPTPDGEQQDRKPQISPIFLLYQRCGAESRRLLMKIEITQAQIYEGLAV